MTARSFAFSAALFAVLATFSLLPQCSIAFLSHVRTPVLGTLLEHINNPQQQPCCCLFMAKSAKKKRKGAKTGAAGKIKGFGAATARAGGIDVKTDRSNEARAFYEFMDKHGAADNLNRVTLGFFPLQDGVSLRGVVALKNINKGDVLIRIPYEMAVNLGPEGADPTLPGLALLKDYCQALRPEDEQEKQLSTISSAIDRTPYYKMLPPFRGDDCLGSTDFFPDHALEALQAPLVMEETIRRRESTKKRFEQDIDDSFPRWLDGSAVTEEHLRWAVWLITSRVLTVQGDAESGRSYRLLIPFLDMCNHDRSSPHVLTGRAVPGGELKVVAGSTVRAGDQINICYGGGVAGNDRFIQDYGFLDSDDAYDITALQLLGKRRALEGASAGQMLSSTDQERSLLALRSTTIEDDVSFLDQALDYFQRSALTYRIGVKQALIRYNALQ